ncbi:MAG TPA: hypothetical protein VK654_04410 [Nitrospirota bacterium]|nr:hypothetical protein [Nitrospirota bacterium]
MSRFKSNRYPALFVILSVMVMMTTSAFSNDDHKVTITSWGNGSPELEITVPSDYGVEKHKGPDFDVHYLASKNPRDPVMGIYIGHHPNLFSSRLKGIAVEREKGTILGQKAEWIAWQDKENDAAVYHCETIVPGVFKGAGASGIAALMLHIFVNGPDKTKVQSLRKTTESMRVIQK